LHDPTSGLEPATGNDQSCVETHRTISILLKQSRQVGLAQRVPLRKSGGGYESFTDRPTPIRQRGRRFAPHLFKASADTSAASPVRRRNALKLQNASVWVRLFMPDYAAAAATLRFLGIGGYAGWRQLRVPNPERVGEALAALRAMSWQEFAAKMEAAFRSDGYAVVALTRGGADFELRKGGRVALARCKRWKVAQTGIEPLRELLLANYTYLQCYSRIATFLPGRKQIQSIRATPQWPSGLKQRS